ncbi:MAG: PIN domain-containing protein [Actinobacteria bacterium]|nr:PIN domain-containing protein [Actinomycetota bacterium]
MPPYLADTSAWNRSTATRDRWAELLRADRLAICAPIRLELLYSARSRSEYASLRDDLAALPELPLDAHAIALAERAQVALAATSQHRGPKVVDLLVAGVAEASGAIVLHYDHHFDAIARVTGQPTEWLARRGSLD